MISDVHNSLLQNENVSLLFPDMELKCTKHKTENIVEGEAYCSLHFPFTKTTSLVQFEVSKWQDAQILYKLMKVLSFTCFFAKLVQQKGFSSESLYT